MNLLFHHKAIYKAGRSLKDFKDEFERKVSPYTEDFSSGLRGEFINNEKFWLTDKWALIAKKSPELNPAYLSGQLTFKGQEVLVSTTARPNYLLVVLFYTNLILFVLTAFRIATPIKVSDDYFTYFLMFMPLLIVFFFLLIKLALRQIQRQVEKQLNLKRMN